MRVTPTLLIIHVDQIPEHLHVHTPQYIYTSYDGSNQLNEIRGKRNALICNSTNVLQKTSRRQTILQCNNRDPDLNSYPSSKIFHTLHMYMYIRSIHFYCIGDCWLLRYTHYEDARALFSNFNEYNRQWSEMYRKETFNEFTSGIAAKDLSRSDIDDEKSAEEMLLLVPCCKQQQQQVDNNSDRERAYNQRCEIKS